MQSSYCETCSDNVCLQKLKNGAFSKLSLDDKKQIIAKGRCLPHLDLTQESATCRRHFNSKQYYEMYNWLTACIHTKRLFCFPCLLFSSSKRVIWNHAGYTDLKNLSNAAKKHDQSESHVDASLKCYIFGKQQLVREASSLQIQIDIDRHNARVNRNRNVFQRLIDIVCFLGKQELISHGHDESASSINEETYLEMVDLLAKYDGMLDNHLQSSTSSFTGLSNRIQIVLISSIASVMMDTIKQQIAAADFVALIVDETQDISGRKLVLVLRYFHNSEVVDRFITYIDVSSDCTAKTLSGTILHFLREFNCLSKLIAQSYDGAAVLSSELNDVQSLVRIECPQALFVWCSTHVLSLVLGKSCESIKETKRFFHVIKTIASFFHTSIKRQAHYNKFADMKKLPHIAENLLNHDALTVNVIFNSRCLLIDLLEDMAEDEGSWDGETLNQASALLFNLKEFEFLFFLHIFKEIIAKCNELYEIMQKNLSNLKYCIQKVKEFELFLELFRLEFEIIYSNVIQCTGPPKRKHRIFDPKIDFKRIFLEIVDNFVNECSNRYKNLKDLHFVQLLSWQNFIAFYSCFPEEILHDFINVYQTHNFNLECLRNELKCLYKSTEFKNLSIKKIIEYSYVNNIAFVFPEVLRLAKLIITVPVSCASTDRSLSSLQNIHKYLRNTQGQQRIADLSMISIEKNLLAEIKRTPSFYDSILQSYLQKDRLEDLIYK